MANRNPPEPAGRPILDTGGTVIGWCWWADNLLHATDDRWGIESTHNGELFDVVAKATAAVRCRAMAASKDHASQTIRVLQIRERLRAIIFDREAGMLSQKDAQARLDELQAELEAMPVLT